MNLKISPTNLQPFHLWFSVLTHWGRVMHLCVNKLTIIGSDNGLSPGRRQAIIWINARLMLIRPLGTNFSEIWIGIQTFSFKKMQLKCRPFCLGLNELTPMAPAWSPIPCVLPVVLHKIGSEHKTFSFAGISYSTKGVASTVFINTFLWLMWFDFTKTMHLWEYHLQLIIW